MAERGIHSSVVLLDHGFPAFSVGLPDRGFDLTDGFLAREYTADGEEAGLHDRVDPPDHAGIFRYLVSIDAIESQLLPDDLFLNPLRKFVPYLVRTVGAVEQKHGAGLRILENVKFLHERGLVTRDEVCAADQVCGMDRLGAEAQVRNGAGAGLLRVIHEIALGEVPGFLPNDLDRVLVSAYCTVRAEAIEQASRGFWTFGRELRGVVDARIGDVIDYADREVILRLCLGQLVKDALDHRGREFFGRKAVAAPDHTRRVV